MFKPKLDALPQAQRNLWPELAATPEAFALYGGTAIALRLGHRISIDFDFFSMVSFVPAQLQSDIPYLEGGVVRQSAANTLTVSLDRYGPVLLSFFGALRIGQVEPPEKTDDGVMTVASLLDLGGMKAAVVTQRAELKDYLDIHALITKGGLSLPAMLSAAGIIYGEAFNPLIALKAISYHGDPALADLETGIRRDLAAAVRGVVLNALHVLPSFRRRPSL